MRNRDMIEKLEDILKQHGNLPIEGYYLNDTTSPRRIIVLNDRGCEWSAGDKAVGVFIE